ncbi:1-(5-phosphoribosyl)-5-[(5-phosphoribosylamino)methylideneamino]imidazole-4-carboxamide isomerase [Fulvivirgaceae bacterium BMA12]|uniref:1-(5-phosphoribosyl)-5-[(5-phosphoribosylamino)methylideneamino] imidazole-4-carboxamide isomerase n=1 Tax=Agaribacillus aureus TaxID=3051825 RepID=A0ABT8LC51_9BACT|nr:1-(5-phosphoribosyl)-5-[(5-phosphoribosylamino)methylideneamino]imidazole-4-carboxamide isomerase [Fulvivirgaceae bacterium BMA12]
MHIIPAIDIIDGKCVRLTQGDYNQKKEYNSDPLEVAKMFEGAGAKRLHLVDLDGAKQKKVVNLKVLESIAAHTELSIDFGGGIQSEEDLKGAFGAGASQVTGGSIAVKNPPLFESWLQNFGNEQIILGADVIDKQIAINGWQEKTTVNLHVFLEEYVQKSIKYVICTDVSKDGLLEGPAMNLYREISNYYPEICLIASGGVSCLEDVHELARIGVEGVIIGKAFYEGRIQLSDLDIYFNE